MSARAKNPRRRVLVITGSRAEFGLLRPVMAAIRKQKRLELRVAVAGEHLLAPAHTWKEVAREFRIDAKVPMQRPRDRGRLDHAAACARGMAGFAAAYKKLKPDWVVVLGDRIEAFAAASAATIAGIAVCHIHGGDRAEGIADEAMRHAITKLAHLHCAATKLSAERIVRMGEPKEHVFVTGSPAIDGLAGIRPMSDAEVKQLNDPRFVVLLHPAQSNLLSARRLRHFSPWPTTTRSEDWHSDYLLAEETFLTFGSVESLDFDRLLVLEPNRDPGREHIVQRWRELRAIGWPRAIAHLPREKFVALLKRLAKSRGVLVGNSSAGLVECAALGVAALNVGDRQAGRERGPNVVDATSFERDANWSAMNRAIGLASTLKPSTRFGDGRSGPRIAALLAKIDPHNSGMLRKRNVY